MTAALFFCVLAITERTRDGLDHENTINVLRERIRQCHLIVLYDLLFLNALPHRMGSKLRWMSLSIVLFALLSLLSVKSSLYVTATRQLKT